MASQHAQLVTEHRDFYVLLVLLRPEGEEVKDSANEQEDHRRAHSDDLAKPGYWLLAGDILDLHPSGRHLGRHLRQIENGQGLPTLTTLVRVAVALGVSPAKLLEDVRAGSA